MTAAGFVGRENELRLLREALHAAASGAGRGVLVSGEAGVGKTTIAERLAHLADAEGAKVLWGRCHEGQGAPPFWPWVQVVRSGAALLPADDVRRALGTGAADVAQLVPQLRDVVPDVAASAPSDLSQSRFRLFDAVTSLLLEIARRTPLVIIVEDLQGADHSSLQLLQFVVREAPRAPLLTVGTYRDGGAARTPALDETLAEALRTSGTVHVALGGFSIDEVRQLVEVRLGETPAPEMVATLHHRTEGNPLFIAELVRAHAADRRRGAQAAASAGDILVPETVRAVIRQHLAGLSAGTREALDLAAVMGREIHADALARCVPAPQLSTALAEGLASGVLGATARSHGQYRFAHALVVETLYEDLHAARRAALHARAAAAIESLPDPRPFLGELAHHLRCVGGADASRRAAEYARAAGDEAMRLGAYEEAERLYESALPTPGEHGDHEERRRPELLIAIGRVRNIGSASQHARAAFREAAACARRLPPSRDASTLFAAAALGFAGDWTGVNEVPADDPSHPMAFDPEVVDLLEEALAALGDRDCAERSRLLARLAQELLLHAPLDRREHMAREAIGIARRLGDPATLAYVISLAHTAMWCAGNVAERAALVEEWIAAARRAGDVGLVAAGHGFEVIVMLELGRADAARRAAVLFERAAEESRQPFLLWALRVQQAMWAMLDGRLDESERLAQEATEHGCRGRASPMRHWALQRIELARERGLTDELAGMARIFRRLGETLPAVPSFRATAALLFMEAGDAGAARSEFEFVVRHDLADVPDDVTRNRSLAELGEVAAALADARLAARLYEMLREYADSYVPGFGATSCWGSMHRILGLLATTMQRWDDAQAHFEAALAANGQLGARVCSARTRYDYAAMLLARGRPDDRDAAVRLARQALVAAEAAGLASLEAKVRALLSGVDAPRPGPETMRTAVKEASPAGPSESAFLVHEGDYWTFGYEGRVVRLRDTKGVHYLTHLLRRPGEEVHVLDLVTGGPGGPGGTTPQRPGRPPADGIGPRLDAKAVDDYRRRRAELCEQLEDAERDNDAGRVARLRREQEFVEAQLTEAFGIGGRSRPTGENAERARLTVTKRISDTIRKVAAAHPALAHHLSTSVKRGYFCVYEPGPSGAPRWEVGGPDRPRP